MLVYFAAAFSMLVFNIRPPLSPSSDASNRTPTVNIVLYMGEVSGTKLGFGFSSMGLTSPGPTLRFTTSDVVNITVINVGSMPHTFAITDAPRTGATVLFRSEIGSDSSPIQPGQQGSVVFAPNQADQSFCYSSTLSGEAEAGMYGTVVINVAPFA